LEPHLVRDVYLAGSTQPNRWVDISTVFETKLQAIRCHVSQIADPAAMVKRVTERHQATDLFGRQIFKEEFHVLTMT
jgi:LmbE family N-acetylglucosaminyl deacetylase